MEFARFAEDHLEVMFLSSPSGGWKARAAMSVARGDKAVAVLNGKLHVVGGESKNQDGHSTPLMDVEVSDLGLLCWVCLLLGPLLLIGF